MLSDEEGRADFELLMHEASAPRSREVHGEILTVLQLHRYMTQVGMITLSRFALPEDNSDGFI